MIAGTLNVLNQGVAHPSHTGASTRLARIGASRAAIRDEPMLIEKASGALITKLAPLYRISVRLSYPLRLRICPAIWRHSCRRVRFPMNNDRCPHRATAVRIRRLGVPTRRRIASS